MIIVDSNNYDDLDLISCMNPVAAILSSQTIGYFTPQIPSFASSLATKLKQSVVIFAPFTTEFPPIEVNFACSNLTIVYQKTTMDYPAQEASEERVKFIRRYLEKTQPKLVVVTIGSLLPAITHINYTPKMVIAYLLELTPWPTNPGYPAFHLWYEFRESIDLFIFPESNRCRIGLQLIGLPEHSTQTTILHNSRIFPLNLQQTQVTKRDNAFFYGGGIRKYQTCGEWFLRPEIQNFPINLYGFLLEFDDPDAVAKAFNDHLFKQRYHGMIPADINYFSILSQHAWSLILWNFTHENSNENIKYASPNKLYDALACGVPFISGSNPLMVDLVEKYGCGIIMDDFRIETFIKTLNKAMKIFGSDEYDRMIEGCAAAMNNECDWELQFDTKIMPHIMKCLV